MTHVALLVVEQMAKPVSDADFTITPLSRHHVVTAGSDEQVFASGLHEEGQCVV